MAARATSALAIIHSVFRLIVVELCQLRFVCGKNWSELSATPVEGARFCCDCNQAVFMVKTPAQLSLASSLGRCVGVADLADRVGVVGQPDGTDSFGWMQSLEEVELSYHGRPSDSSLQLLRLLYPVAFDERAEQSLMGGRTVRLGSFGPMARDAMAQELAFCVPEAALGVVSS